MKMVKSLILGTAVAFAATAVAPAADLPVKAKPVSYVKICPQYGPGFYYIPGTDICLKVGGLLLAEVGYNARSATPVLNAYEGTTIEPFRNDVNWRTRAYVALDARQNTAYGVLRTYLYGGFEYVTGNHGLNGSVVNAAGVSGNGGSGGFMQFAFVQFAGFTAGIATSFFDFAPSYMPLGVAAVPWNWNNLIAYTARFGNGVSATISIEDATNYRVGVSGVTASAPAILGVGLIAANGYAGHDMPDVIANIRIDQAWAVAPALAGLLDDVLGSGLHLREGDTPSVLFERAHDFPCSNSRAT
ncbi:MAG: porin [Sphingopyxis sp.]|nr:porin [Sphingopyxis sp.]